MHRVTPLIKGQKKSLVMWLQNEGAKKIMCGFVVTTRKNDVEYMTMRQKHRGPSGPCFLERR